MRACLLLFLLGWSLNGQQGAFDSLEQLYQPSTMLMDRDGDGFVDGIRAHLVLDSEEAEVVAAAAEIGARLGLLTCALDQSLLAQNQGPEIHVGRRAAGLVPPKGLGLIALQEGRLWVLGEAPGSLLAAARIAAGWLPGLPGGGSLAGLKKELLRQSRGRPVLITRIQVRPGARGLARIVASMPKGAPASLQPTAPLKLLGLELLQVVGPGGQVLLSLPGAKPLELPALDALPRKKSPPRFGLEQLFSPEGALLDGDGDLVPDGCTTRVVPSGEAGCRGAVDIATRLGLESAGLSFPMTALPHKLKAQDVQGLLILVGEHQPLVQDLIRRGLWKPSPLPPGRGELRLVPKAFQKNAVLLVRGGDAQGLLRAGSLLLRRLPHLRDGRLGIPDLRDLVLETRRFLAGVSPAGQGARVPRAAAILAKNPDLPREAPFYAALAALPNTPAAREAQLRHYQQVAGARIKALFEMDPRRPAAQRVVVAHTWKLPYEADRLREAFVKRALPLLQKGQHVKLQALVSEPRVVRDKLRDEMAKAILKITRVEPEVVVLSAYKQGFHFLTEVVLPALLSREVVRLEIAAPLYTHRSAARWSTLHARGRWLQELQPALEILAQKLKLDPDRDIRFRQLPEERDPLEAQPRVHYEVKAWTAAGGQPLHFSFEPALREMPYSRVFPGYEQVLVSTGRLRLFVGDQLAHEERLETDLETIWRYYQEQVLTPLAEDLMNQSRGRPGRIRPPQFIADHVTVTCSEEDRLLSVGREFVSPAEALYEEFYFHTLWFTSFVGQFYRGKPLRYPGSVIPQVVVVPGKAPTLSVRLVSKRFPAPGVWTSPTPLEGAFRLIPRVRVEEPHVRAIVVHPGGELTVEIAVRCSRDRDEWEAWVREAPPQEVDRELFAVETGVALVHELGVLRGLGIYRDTFRYPEVRALHFVFEGPQSVGRAQLETDAQSWRPPLPEKPPSGTLRIPHTEPIGPSQCASLLAGLARHGGSRIYRVARSFAGRDVWVLETGPVGARHYSRQKLAAWKPVLLISAREHANEVSSTNHVLQFLQDTLKEPALLKKVTLVVQPIWNADGAALAVQQYKDHPNWMLHAGYLGALGENLAAGMNDPDPVQPEAHARLQLFAHHLPDIFLNPHGYPTHEWVQPFSGYVAWVRGREPHTRDWWGARGWFLQHFTWPRGEAFKEQRQVALALRESIARAVGALPLVMAENKREAARYLRYGQWDPATYRLPLVNGVQVNGPPAGSKVDKKSSNFALRFPKTCAFFGIAEAPDETAHGSFLKLVMQAGEAFERASRDYLARGQTRLATKLTPYRNGVRRKRARKRPVLPKQEGGK